MRPDWFDWLTLVITALAAVVPAWLAIALWRSDRKEAMRARRDACIREFTQLLATGDRILLRFRDFSHFADGMGPGSVALLALINQYLEWAGDEERDEDELQHSREPRIDLSIDVTEAIRRWNQDAAYRADLTELWLANECLFPEPEDNRIISPTTRRAAEDEILRNPGYRTWLAGTRLAPARIRLRRLRGRLPVFSEEPIEPLNPLATKIYLEVEDLAGDEWLRARTTATLETGDE
jgi:hypothetical protein